MTVAVVTGGGRGIGAATCVALARAGWDVCVGYRADADAAAQVVAACTAEGVRAVAAPGDVASEDGVAAVFGAADTLGPLGALVNNAGIVDVVSAVADMSAARIRRMFEVNAVAPFLCVQAAIPRMSSRRGGAGGVIVNVGSISARAPGPNRYLDYSASKAAVDAMTIGLAKELAPDAIRVNCVRPGIIDTEIHASAGQPNRAREAGDLIPMGRAGTTAEIAHAIAWLCSAEASYVSGAIMDVGGAI